MLTCCTLYSTDFNKLSKLKKILIETKNELNRIGKPRNLLSEFLQSCRLQTV